MLSVAELDVIARARLEDAEVLLNGCRYDGAVYLCGYAVEVALKARICRTLVWEGYPSTAGEFRNLQSFKTHDLDVLLALSGVERKIKTEHLAHWSAVAQWDPEVRYKPIGKAGPDETRIMVESAKILLREL